MNINKIKSQFEVLDKELKKFGRTKCKFRNPAKLTMVECKHPAMAYGGLNTDTDCEIANCPRVLYGDHDKDKESS